MSACVVVGTAKDGPSALRAADALRPDVIVLDISLPHMTGFEVAAKLRQSGSTATVVFLSVHAEEDIVARAKAIGAIGYVVKPRLLTRPVARRDGSARRTRVRFVASLIPSWSSMKPVVVPRGPPSHRSSTLEAAGFVIETVRELRVPAEATWRGASGSSGEATSAAIDAPRSFRRARCNGAAILEKPESDRGTLEDLSQSHPCPDQSVTVSI